MVLPQGLPASESLKRAHQAFLAFDSRSWLPSLDVPVLTLGGTDDPVVPLIHVRALHERLQRSTLVAIEGGGHVPTLQGAKRAREAIRNFLQAF